MACRKKTISIKRSYPLYPLQSISSSEIARMEQEYPEIWDLTWSYIEKADAASKTSRKYRDKAAKLVRQMKK